MPAAYVYKTKPNVFDNLQDILQEMDVPKRRLGNMKWLYQNLELSNMGHPDIDKAITLIEKLLFMDKPKKVSDRNTRRK
jgi:hypothetical protein